MPPSPSPVAHAEPRLRRAALLSGVAEGVVATALPLLATAVSGDPLAIAAVVAAQHGPWILVAIAWPLVARADRRTVVGLVHTMRALAVAYLGVHAMASTETIFKIQLVALLVGLGEALNGTVEDEAADSRLSTRGMWGVALVGMPLGGVLYEVFVAVPFLMDVFFFALAALFALFVPRPFTRVAARQKMRLAKGTGPVAFVALLAAVGRSAVLGILVLFAIHDLDLGAPAFGLVLAGLAAATAGGGWVAPETGSALGLKAGFGVAAVVSGAALVTAARVANVDRPWAAVVALGIAWATATTGTVLLRALLPAAAGRPVTGGALRAFHVVEWVGVCAGALVGGWIARDRSVVDAVQLAAVPWALAAMAVIAVRRRPVIEADDASVDNWLDAA